MTVGCLPKPARSSLEFRSRCSRPASERSFSAAGKTTGARSSFTDSAKVRPSSRCVRRFASNWVQNKRHNQTPGALLRLLFAGLPLPKARAFRVVSARYRARSRLGSQPHSPIPRDCAPGVAIEDATRHFGASNGAPSRANLEDSRHDGRHRSNRVIAVPAHNFQRIRAHFADPHFGTRCSRDAFVEDDRGRKHEPACCASKNTA